MTVFLNILGFAGIVVVLVLAGVGVYTIASGLMKPIESRSERRRREAEEAVSEAARQAQIAILGEAIKRVLRADTASAGTHRVHEGEFAGGGD